MTRLRVPLGLAVAAAALYLLAASRRDFWAPDEPDFAEHVREMIERGNFLVPWQNGKPYSEKPILFYWAMALTTPFTGGDVSPLGTRVPSALSGGFLVFAAAWLAGRRGGSVEALVAGAATGVAPIVFWQSQFVQIDAFFAALVLGVLLAQFLIEDDPGRAGRWRWALHILLPLAVLAKGPLALVLVGGVTLVRCVASRSFGPLTRLRPVRGAAVFLLLVVPWYVAAARTGGPAYAYDLLVNQNWNRFFHAFDHIQPWWFYLQSIWSDFFPFTLPALVALVIVFRAGLFRDRPELKYAAQAVGVAFVFLSLAGSKQGKYLLVAYPLLAVLLAAGARFAGREGEGRRLLRAIALLLALLLLALAVLLVVVGRRELPRFAGLAAPLALPLGLGGTGTIAILAARRREVSAALLALALTMGAGEAAVGAVVFPAVDVLKTGRPFYERIRPRLSHGEPLAYYGETYRCYAILVLRRRTEHFWTEGSLADWLRRTRGARVLVDASEVRGWRDRRLRSLAILDRQPVGGDEALLLGIR